MVLHKLFLFSLLALLPLQTATSSKQELNDQLFEAVRKGDAAAVTAALDKGADVNTKFRYGATALFKAAEVCELVKVQPYVLRSWESEFKDLGVAKSGSTARVYRREDVELVLRIKHLLLIEGLTLAGVRRRLEEESEPPLEEEPAYARAA